MAKTFSGQYKGESQIGYKTVNNKKLLSFWLLINNIYNVIIIGMMISTTVSLYVAFSSFTSGYNWLVYVMAGIVVLYTVCFLWILISGRQEKDAARALRNTLYYRGIVVISRRVIMIFYMVIIYFLLFDSLINDIGLSAGWSYFIGVVAIVYSVLIILYQIFLFGFKKKNYQRQQKRRREIKSYVKSLRKDVELEQQLVKQKEVEVEAQKHSIYYRIWSMYQHRYVQVNKVEVPASDEMVFAVDDSPEEEILPLEIIYAEPVESNNPVEVSAVVDDNENDEDDESEKNLLDTEDSEVRFLYDAAAKTDDESDIIDDTDDSLSMADIISDFSNIFDFPDGKKWSDD